MDDGYELSDEELEEINQVTAEREAIYTDIHNFLQKRIGQATISAKYVPAYRGFVTRTVVVAEIQGDDGNLYLLQIEPSDGAPWRTVGMLETAADCVKADAFDL